MVILHLVTKESLYFQKNLISFRFTPIKGTVSQDFWPSDFFIKQSPLGPKAVLHMVFAEKIDSEIAKIGFHGLHETAETDIFCQSSPLIVTLSSNYRYAMITYVMVFTMVSL
jgi:hypothetical protein